MAWLLPLGEDNAFHLRENGVYLGHLHGAVIDEDNVCGPDVPGLEDAPHRLGLGFPMHLQIGNRFSLERRISLRASACST